MAIRRDEIVAALLEVGLSADEAEAEVDYREAEAERIIEEDDGDPAGASQRARDHLLAREPIYVRPKLRPATAASPPPVQSAAALPARLSQPEPAPGPDDAEARAAYPPRAVAPFIPAPSRQQATAAAEPAEQTFIPPRPRSAPQARPVEPAPVPAARAPEPRPARQERPVDPAPTPTADPKPVARQALRQQPIAPRRASQTSVPATRLTAPAELAELSPRQSRKARRAQLALEASRDNTSTSVSSPRGLRRIPNAFRSYQDWTSSGAKWRLLAGIGAPLVALLLVAGVVYVLTTSSDDKVSDASAPASAGYVAYVQVMQATVSAYATDISAIAKLADPQAPRGPTWADQIVAAAQDIKDKGARLSQIGVPLCLADSHAALMIGVSNMDRAATNLITGVQTQNVVSVNNYAILINSATPQVNDAATAIQKRRC